MITRALNGETTAQEQAYANLRKRVLVGDLAPGQKLTLRGIAAELGLSPTPVREALRRLAAEGALHVQQNRRVIVPKPTTAQLVELVQLRCAVEIHLAERALPFVSDHLVATMRAVDDDIDAAVVARDYAGIVLENQRFHALLFAANPTHVGLPLVDSLWLQLGPCMRIAASFVDELYPEDHHKVLLDALSVRDAERVKRTLTQDIQAGFGDLRDSALRKLLG
ncbi:MAG: GntR family transcriptional regulator [Pseudomonadota bacterium]